MILLKCALKDEIAPVYKDINIDELLKLANVQQVYNTVLPALEKTGMLDKENYSKWNNYRLSELKRTVYVDNLRNQICKDLDEQGIKYMFLKGLVIREYYPQTLMRQMSDNDILFDAQRRDDLAKIMNKHGFILTVGTDKSDDYFKEPDCLIEFHRELFNHIEIMDAYPASLVWERSKKENDATQKFLISPEDNYAYTLVHMYKHYIMEGCGVRFLCDMYLLHNSGENLDFGYIDSLMDKIGIVDFKNTVIGLTMDVFDDKVPDEKEIELLNFMFNGSVYGKGKDIGERIQEHGGKFKYIMDRLFPSKDIMFNTYTVLEKKPYLLLYYYFVRIFQRLRHKKKSIKKEFDSIKKS